MASYLELNFKIRPLQPASDILIAELGAVGFESFVENKDGISAYIPSKDWDEDLLAHASILKNENFQFEVTSKKIPHENWNATWERNFSPIQVGELCTVRAPFHDQTKANYDIVISPKMSFGTGHHQTTYMMLQLLLGQDVAGKSVLDMGSGTGVLAILAAKKGANPVTAIDIDHWCFINAQENIALNGLTNVEVKEGGAELLGIRQYDLILANINRNILLADISIYAKNLAKDGALFLSGFYRIDLPVISNRCSECGLKLEKNLEKEDWVAAKYVF